MIRGVVGALCYSQEQFFSLLSEYYSEDDLELIKQQFDSGSSWSLCEIFWKPSSHHMGFKHNDFSCMNPEIHYHLQVVYEMIQNGYLYPSQVKISKQWKPFSMVISREVENGQCKLAFSLFTFVMEAVKKGFRSGTEVGSGPGRGGLNHSAVNEMLDSVLKGTFNLNMIDPLSDDFQENKKKIVLNGSKSSVIKGQSFFEPVFSDIFEDDTWDIIQRSLKAPMIMYKRQYAPYQYRAGVILQPFHLETRELKGYKQLGRIFKGFFHLSQFFDNCRNCILLKTLTQYGISDEDLYFALLKLDWYPCLSAPGNSYIRHRSQFSGYEKDVALRIAQGVSVIEIREGKEVEKKLQKKIPGIKMDFRKYTGYKGKKKRMERFQRKEVHMVPSMFEESLYVRVNEVFGDDVVLISSHYKLGSFYSNMIDYRGEGYDYTYYTNFAVFDRLDVAFGQVLVDSRVGSNLFFRIQMSKDMSHELHIELLRFGFRALHVFEDSGDFTPMFGGHYQKVTSVVVAWELKVIVSNISVQ